MVDTSKSRNLRSSMSPELRNTIIDSRRIVELTEQLKRKKFVASRLAEVASTLADLLQQATEDIGSWVTTGEQSRKIHATRLYNERLLPTLSGLPQVFSELVESEPMFHTEAEPDGAVNMARGADGRTQQNKWCGRVMWKNIEVYSTGYVHRDATDAMGAADNEFVAALQTFIADLAKRKEASKKKKETPAPVEGQGSSE